MGVNDNGEIFFRTEITKELKEGKAWEQIPGHLKMVSTSGTHVTWGIDRLGKLWFHNDGKQNKIPVRKATSDYWWKIKSDFDFHAKTLDVGRDGQVWACSTQGKVYYRKDILDNEKERSTDGLTGPNGKAWALPPNKDTKAQSPESCKSIALCAGTGNVWVVAASGDQIWFRSGMKKTDLVGTGWELVASMGSGDSSNTFSHPIQEVACGGNYQLYFTDSEGNVLQRTKIDDHSKPQGEEFKVVTKG